MPHAFALSIAGCPYLFTTGGLASPPSSSSPLWFGGDLTLADGFLSWPRNRWTERAKPMDGELDVNPQSFTLHDASLTAGGSPLLSGLATRNAINVPSTPLAADITATDTSATVGDGSLFGAPCFAWVEAECVEVTAVVGNVLTITRGALGTKPAVHRTDAAEGRFPEVFTALPWTTRRKVGLWLVDRATNVARLLWLGFATRAPVLAEDGARLDLPCDHYWIVAANNPVGGVLPSFPLVGYGRTGTSGTVMNAESALLQTGFVLNSTGARDTVGTTGPFRDFDALARAHEQTISDVTAALGQRVEAHINRGSRAASIGLWTSTSTAAIYTVFHTWIGVTTDRALTSWETSTRQGVTIPFGEIPRCAYVTTPGTSNTWCVSSLGGLPASWGATVNTVGSLTTSEAPALRAVINDEWFALLTNATTADGGELGPRITATVTTAPRKASSHRQPDVIIIKDPPPLQLVYSVRTDHWALGLRYSVVGLCEDTVSDDWDWTDVVDLVGTASGAAAARRWLFDGKRTLGNVVAESCLIHGCTPVVRGGRMALHAWAWPSAAAPAASINAARIIGRPTWFRWQDGIANQLKVKSEDLVINATQAQSRARYGPGRNISIELAGTEQQAIVHDDPLAFARGLLGRLELWSDPLDVARFTVPCDLDTGDGAALTTLELGRELVLTEWMLPDGTGGRGLTAARATVIARDVDLGAATVTVDALLFPRVSYPYAPCGKVGSLVSSTVVALATGYVDGVSSYSGGNDAATFEAGDEVELIERDTVTPWSERLKITSVDVALGRLTFTGALSATAQGKITGGAWVDVRYAPFSQCTPTQQALWMFVGSEAAEVIDGTAEPARLIAP